MVIDKIALALAIIGALNWGGIGLFGFDTVAFLCGGQMAILSRIIYALVGLGGPVVHHAVVPLLRRGDGPRPPHRLTADTARFSKYGEPTKRPAPVFAGSQSPEQISRGPWSPPCSPSFRYFWSLARSSAETISSCSIFS